MSGAIKYQAVVDLAERNNSHTMLHELAIAGGQPGLEILEVGCSSGYLGASLVAKGHRVTGVEPDPAASQAARNQLAEVFTGGLDDYLDAHPGRSFDVVLFGDVLEHLPDPAAALARTRAHLRPGGRVVISVPNVAHGSVRAMLLAGRWDYSEKGILDHTHLRFFTREELARMLAQAGFALEELRSVGQPVDVVGREYGMALDRDLVTAVELLDRDGSRLAFQYVLSARPRDEDRATLAVANLAVPCEALLAHAPLPGARSWKQALQVRLFHALLRRISRRRFRGA